MEYHAKAWFDILNNDLKANLSWQEVKSHMYGKNEELLVRIFGKGHFTQQEMDALSMEKEKKYQAGFRPHLQLIKGLDSFLQKAAAQSVQMAIGTAAIPFNVDFILDNIPIRKFFKAVVTADDVITSKPDPEVFVKCADQLQMAHEDCIVFEDAPKGVEAAYNAGMKAVVITSYHEKEDFAYLPNVLLFVKDYTDKNLDNLL
jgi:HAD superfamily hydrolase (TIGR01509 family)